jgi:hypothetical protein
MKVERRYKIETVRDGRTPSYTEGTLDELIKYFSYTLEVGQSWERESGNKKINRNPKTIKSLITNIQNAKENAAANGYSGTHYSLV